MKTKNLPSPIGNVYAKYSTTNPIERLLVSRFNNSVLKLIRQISPASMLDVGCGEGFLTAMVQEAFPQMNITALDLGYSLLPQAHQQTPHVLFLGASADRLPFGDGQFDLVMATETLEHLTNPADALAEICRVSRGHILLTVPWEPVWRMLNCLRGAYLRQWGNTPGHVQHWGRRSFFSFCSRYSQPLHRGSVFPWLVYLGCVPDTMCPIYS